jgi:non-specific protein-tyrosine kinase
MERLLALIASSDIETVVVDTRALLGLSDTSILAPRMDAVVVVVDITRANQKELKHMQAALSQIGTRVLGCVANKQHNGYEGAAYYAASELRNEEIDATIDLEREQNAAPDEKEAETEHSRAVQNGHGADASASTLPPLSATSRPRSAQSN